MAKLFTADIDKKLFEQYKFGGDLSKQEVVAKIFNPYGSGTWYLLNSDPQDPDYIWAIVDMFDVEIGSVSRNDLETMKVPPFQLHLERDKFFQPMNAQILYLRLRGGEKFEEGGEVSDRISEMVKHWNKYGWASSNINNDDSEFFKRIGKSYIDTATTSFTGNDINYYDADRVEVAGGSFKQKFATGGTTDCGCQHRMEEGGAMNNNYDNIISEYRNYIDKKYNDSVKFWEQQRDNGMVKMVTQDKADHLVVINEMKQGNWDIAYKIWADMDTASRENITNDAYDLLMQKNNLDKKFDNGGAMDYKNKFGLVKVKFKNPKYNYSTNVSADTTEKDARKYFVGQMFNVGSYPREIMREVVDIEFYEKGTYAEGGEISEDKLWGWIKTIDDENLLSWCGFSSKKEFEDSTDTNYSKRNLFESNYDDLLYAYENKSEYGFSKGGEIANSNNEMLQSQLKAVEHHAKELSSIVTDKTPVEAWVVGKIERASTDLSDITHYLDGQKFEMGGKIENQYFGKTPKEVYELWDYGQKYEFFKDHFENLGAYSNSEYKRLPSKKYDELDKIAKDALIEHIKGGQYADGGTIEKDTPILVGMIAENVARYKYFEKNNVPKQNEPQLIKKADETIAKLEKHLEQKANTVYKNNEMFKKQLNQKGNKGRDALYMYMEHWANAFLGKGYAKGGTMANGGILPKSEFTIQEIKEHLLNEFPDSFSFALYPLKRDTKHTPDYDAVKSYKGLMDSEIKGKLKFPQYKPTHSINYGISQGGENTYFEFLLETQQDYYVGTFGFKDEGDVPANYITKFLAFLQKSYGLPFEIIHEVMAKGGVTYNTGRSWHQDRARHNKAESWEKPLGQRKMDSGGKMMAKGLEWEDNLYLTHPILNQFLDDSELYYGFTNNEMIEFIKKLNSLGYDCDVYSKNTDIIFNPNKKQKKGTTDLYVGFQPINIRLKKTADGGMMGMGGEVKEFNLREIKSLSIGNQKYLTDDRNGKNYIYENGILYDVDEIDKAPHYKKGSSHRMSKIKVNIVGEMAMGSKIEENKWVVFLDAENGEEIEEEIIATDQESAEDKAQKIHPTATVVGSSQINFEKGGEVKFSDKVKEVKASLLKTKKVSPKVQKDYGKTYSPKEAEQAAKRIVGSRTAKWKERISNNK